MAKSQQFYINGQWVEPSSKKTIEVYNPANNQVICSLACANEADVNAAVSAAHSAFNSFSTTSVQERYELISDINNLLQKRNDDIAAAISLEMGAPIALAKGAQAPSGSQHFSEILRVLKSYQFDNTTENGTLIRKLPIGVCALITPWNWPMNQIATKVAPALAAGCTMVLKPSEIAPLDALILAEIMHEAGVPAGVFNLINGTGADIGDSLTSHPFVDMVSFTGSTRAGVAIAKSAAPTVKRVALELGGKSAGIVTENVDIDQVAKDAISSSMLNSGQSCNALTRLLVPESLLAEMEQALVKVASELSVDVPENNPYMGPVASAVHHQKVQSYITSGIQQGAKLLIGGKENPATLTQGCFVQPTIFSNVTSDMTIAREEIFGPVLSVLAYNDLDEAIKIANDSEYGLSGYVWDKDIATARAISSKMRTGMVHINGAGLDSSAPFGGFKMSGNGREWGAHGLDEFLEYQSVYHPN